MYLLNDLICLINNRSSYSSTAQNPIIVVDPELYRQLPETLIRVLEITSPTTQGVLFNSYEMHIGPNSTDQSNLKSNLQTLYNFLNDDNANARHKQQIASYLTEDIDYCIDGLRVRAEASIKSLHAPNDILDFIAEAMYAYSDTFAKEISYLITSKRKTPKFALSDEEIILFDSANHVHFTQYVLKELQIYWGLPVKSFTTNDPIFETFNRLSRIKRWFDLAIAQKYMAEYPKNFTAFNLLNKIITQIQTGLMTFFEYDGPKNYTITEQTSFSNFLSRLIDCEIPFTELFELHEPDDPNLSIEQVAAQTKTDINWHQYQLRLLEFLLEQNYFPYNDEQKEILKKLIHKNTSGIQLTTLITIFENPYDVKGFIDLFAFLDNDNKQKIYRIFLKNYPPFLNIMHKSLPDIKLYEVMRDNLNDLIDDENFVIASKEIYGHILKINKDNFNPLEPKYFNFLPDALRFGSENEVKVALHTLKLMPREKMKEILTTKYYSSAMMPLLVAIEYRQKCVLEIIDLMADVNIDLERIFLQFTSTEKNNLLMLARNTNQDTLGRLLDIMFTFPSETIVRVLKHKDFVSRTLLHKVFMDSDEHLLFLINRLKEKLSKDMFLDVMLDSNIFPMVCAEKTHFFDDIFKIIKSFRSPKQRKQFYLQKIGHTNSINLFSINEPQSAVKLVREVFNVMSYQELIPLLVALYETIELNYLITENSVRKEQYLKLNYKVEMLLIFSDVQSKLTSPQKAKWKRELSNYLVETIEEKEEKFLKKWEDFLKLHAVVNMEIQEPDATPEVITYPIEEPQISASSNTFFQESGRKRAPDENRELEPEVEEKHPRL